MLSFMAEESDKKSLILIVDDVPKNLQVLAAILYKEGYEIAMADRGKSALELLENVIPDLILLDIMMPEMDGFEVCKRIKQNPKHQDIPIIFLTARHETETIVKGFESGAADYLTKPFNALELISRVKTHLQLKQRTTLLLELNATLEEKVKERTAQLEAAYDKLAKLDNAKSYFLGLLSHELNTPLNEIKGFSIILNSIVDDADAKEFIGYIRESSERLIKFADMSLLITSLKSNKYQKQNLEIDVHYLLDESIFNFNETAGDKNIAIEKEYCDCHSLILADTTLIKTAFDTVIGNSIKYSSNNKNIRIRTLNEDNYLKIEFTDQGPGFSEKSLENIFELFNTTELLNHKEGLGLGLATTKFIIDYHSGKISVCNNLNGGATVCLYLPTINQAEKMLEN